MRVILSMLMLLAALADRALAEARPVVLPNGPAVEYVARFTEKLGRETRIVYHRDGKTRVDVMRHGGVASTYRDRRHTTAVTLFRRGGSRFNALQIRSGTEPGFVTSELTQTERSETILGQRCNIWSTATTSTHWKQAISTESCLTEDGIELSYTLLGSTGSIILSSEAFAVERRSVDPAEVEVPAEVFKLGYWIAEDSKTADNGPRPADFEATFVWPIIKQIRPHEKVRTTRRHFPWSFQRTASEDEQELVIHNLTAETTFRFNTKSNGAYRHLLIARNAGPLNIDRAAPLNRSDVVLGESCSWFDMHPGAMDGGLEQCRTPDGIVLKETLIVRSSRETIAARRFQRRPIDISRVMPSPEILTPAYWGLPQ